MRSLQDNRAAVDVITVVITAAILFAVSLPVVFPVISSINIEGLDDDIQRDVLQRTGTHDLTLDNTTYVLNASTSLVDNLETFYDIGPLYIVVVAAVAIVGAVLLLRKRS